MTVAKALSILRKALFHGGFHPNCTQVAPLFLNQAKPGVELPESNSQSLNTALFFIFVKDFGMDWALD
ncbi:MAG TPA: hypothetical protein DCQ32_11655 [Cyanobacteria bacterium UBA8156]|nr:hypothetical protein [Cyanobacteria bacterium UBA8156]